ncbi:hypothetical protein AJ80_00069 [Polytolypa hystricis UAMH7299]|uniref:Senescence domain-containing protein n=1 Tax=Polytolypa hystricis (strain UAMH7299) TaxID=1447883 RepID=A0A2B7Z4K1_POLH7|nr:hypothetical protein AJ80_00069 [Polytolypa hystricis UAMH7299]
MSGGSRDPCLFFSIGNIRAFHVQDGQEADLTPSGPQTLSLLMVPTTPPADPNNPFAPTEAAEDDFYLHLHLPPELDIPLPATTQIYHQPPNSYLIPRWDLGPEAGAFTRIQFPSIGKGPQQVSQEDVDTFETILAQCTAFLERSPVPKDHTTYNPATYAPGEGYIGGEPGRPTDQKHGQIVLVDEENGSVVGELTEGFNVVEAADVKHGSKNPVQIQLPSEGNQISVSNVSEEYLQTARRPAYAKSSIVQTSATASRLIVTGSEFIAKSLQSGADTFTKKVKPNAQPMTFTPTAQDRIRKINTFTSSAAGFSAKTVSHISRYAQNLGASVARKGEKDTQPKGFDKDGNPIYNYKPGILNKSLIAFSTLADGVEQGARTLLQTSQQTATTVVAHRYGPEAGEVTSHVTGGVKNVGLVYIDATGVSRKAVLKSVAKGMVVGRMKDGQNIIVGGGDGGQPPPGMDGPQYGQQRGNSQFPPPPRNGSPAYPLRRPSPSPTPPPAYSDRGGRSLGGTQMRNNKHEYR